MTITGFLDTFRATLDDAQHELLRGIPDRVSVALDSFYPAGGPVVAAVRALPQAGQVQAGLQIPATVRSGNHSLEILTEVLPPSPAWTPSLVSGDLDGGLVLARKAAADLGVRTGDTVVMQHPVAERGGMRTAVSRVVVTGIHPNPMRALAYMSSSAAPVFGLEGAANVLTVQPAAGSSAAALQRALLGVPHVTSAQSIRATTDGLRTSLDQFVGILNVAAAVALLLALLIAFNNASIGVEERAREHATMAAFGLPLRTILSMTVTEAALIGSLGTLAGIAGGYGLLSWMVSTTIPAVMPEIGVTTTLSAGSIAAALALGLATVTVAPLFTARKLRRMDIPATLRIVE